MSELRKFEAEVFKALAHPTRILIIDALREGERNVNELSGLLELQGSNVSQQLAILRNNNLVETRKDGNNVYYSIKDSSVLKMLTICRKFFNNHLNNLNSHLNYMLYFFYMFSQLSFEFEFCELALAV